MQNGRGKKRKPGWQQKLLLLLKGTQDLLHHASEHLYMYINTAARKAISSIHAMRIWLQCTEASPNSFVYQLSRQRREQARVEAKRQKAEEERIRQAAAALAAAEAEAARQAEAAAQQVRHALTMTLCF